MWSLKTLRRIANRSSGKTRLLGKGQGCSRSFHRGKTLFVELLATRFEAVQTWQVPSSDESFSRRYDSVILIWLSKVTSRLHRQSSSLKPLSRVNKNVAQTHFERLGDDIISCFLDCSKSKMHIFRKQNTKLKPHIKALRDLWAFPDDNGERKMMMLLHVCVLPNVKENNSQQLPLVKNLWELDTQMNDVVVHTNISTSDNVNLCDQIMQCHIVYKKKLKDKPFQTYMSNRKNFPERTIPCGVTAQCKKRT